MDFFRYFEAASQRTVSVMRKATKANIGRYQLNNSEYHSGSIFGFLFKRRASENQTQTITGYQEMAAVLVIVVFALF